MKHSTRILCLMVFLLGFLTLANAQWKNISGPSKGLVWNYFKQDGRLFAITRNSVSYSDNEGKTWKLLKGSNKFSSVNDLQVDGTDIYLSVTNVKTGNYHYSEFYKTSDLGESRTKLQSPESFTFDVFNDTLIVFNNVSANRRMVIKTKDETNTIFDQAVGDITHGPVLQHEGHYFFVYNNNVVRTKDFINREIVFQQDIKGYINPLVLYQDKLFFIRYSHSKAKLQIFKFNGTGFDLYSEHSGILNPFVKNLSWDERYFCIKQESTGSVFISTDTLRTFSERKTSDFKTFFPHMAVIEGHFYGSRDNGIYRMKITEPTVQENITHNFKGFQYNTFTFSNDVLYSDENPVWAFDTSAELWAEVPEFKHNAFAVSGDSLVFILKKTYGKPDSLLKQYTTGVVSSVIAPPNVYEGALRQAGDFLIYGNSAVRYISRDAGNSWYEYRSTNWDNYLEVSGEYAVRSTNLASYISKDLVNWQKISLYFNDADLASITPVGDIYQFDGYYLRKQEQGSNQIKNINVISNVGGISYLSIIENFIFIAHPFKGVFYSPNDGLNWFEFSEGLEQLNFTDMELHAGELYLGTSCVIYKRAVSDITAKLKSGRVFYDVNQNSKQDNLEVGVPQIKVLTSLDQTMVRSDSLGLFTTYSLEDAGNEISVIPPARGRATNGPLPVDTMDSNYNLGLYFDPDDRDVGIKWLPGRTFRPGFIGSMKLIVQNYNFFREKISVSLFKDQRLTLDSATILPSFIGDTLLVWDNMELAEFGTKEIELFFRLDSTTAIGELLMFTAAITLLDEVDVDTTNNECKGIAVVRGAYDPNDKLVNPHSDLIVTNGRNDDVLTYTIRFQNTGNYPAEFVRIVDTLDESLDLKSFEFLSASHPAGWSISGNRVLTIRFNNINLVDSLTSSEASQGYFSYTLKLKDELQVNAEVRNTAAIYFDYNEAVVTNTVQNKLTAATRIEEVSNEEVSVRIYPQPAGQYLVVETKDMPVTGYAIYSISGALLQTASVDTSSTTCTVKTDNLVPGTYLIRVKYGNKSSVLPFQKIQ
ncbi:MAG: T9SS type A sorting domain-containing protein [Saprospiraceae bacterium]|nr:T9SS type A sorting domain-containing protein [Saprospiraceae bacterium]